MTRIAIVLLVLFALLAALSGAACSSSNPNFASNRPTPTPLKTPYRPKNGDYPGHGKITKINNELGSVELDHEDIPDVMPAMKMEFFVTDKAMLKGLKVGDSANFTLRYKDDQEYIVAISKAK